jgi:hypothetical protein
VLIKSWRRLAVCDAPDALQQVLTLAREFIMKGST